MKVYTELKIKNKVIFKYFSDNNRNIYLAIRIGVLLRIVYTKYRYTYKVC
jgi:hypothetical protein